MFNGMGYSQSTFSWNCYESFEKVVDLVDQWFEKQLQTKTLPQAICYYNEGRLKDTCPYYERFLTLAK